MVVKLKILSGTSAGKEISVPVDQFVIGRSNDCQLRPKSDSISRRHCELRIVGDKVAVRDLGSKNGTLLNGKKISDSAKKLHSGDVIKVGKFEFQVIIEQPEAIPAAKTEKAAPRRAESKPEGPPDEKDITDWLQEEVTEEAKTETIHVRLDETARAKLNTSSLEPSTEQADQADEVVAEDASEGDASDEDKPAKKKAPSKLPQRPSLINSSENSQDAAADMLRRFFNRR